jgi:hypothetical protein
MHNDKWISTLIWSSILTLGCLGLVTRQFYLPIELLLLPMFFKMKWDVRFIYGFYYLTFSAFIGFISSQYFDLPFPWHDYLALSLALMILTTLAKGDSIGYIWRYARGSFFIFVISAFIGLAIGNFYFGSGVLDFRLLGLSLNPNQIGLYAISLAVILDSTTSNLRSRFIYLSICFIIGVLSGSDAYLVAVAVWFISVMIKIVFARHWFNIIKAFCLFSLIILTIILYELDFDVQALERLNRWYFAFSLLSDFPYAGIFGFGIGPYGPPFAYTFSDELFLDKSISVAGTEFHNSFIDFFISFGLIGFVLIILLMRSFPGRIVVTPGLLGLLAYAFFHLTFRHPIFWVAILASTRDMHILVPIFYKKLPTPSAR